MVHHVLLQQTQPVDTAVIRAELQRQYPHSNLNLKHVPNALTVLIRKGVHRVDDPNSTYYKYAVEGLFESYVNERNYKLKQ